MRDSVPPPAAGSGCTRDDDVDHRRPACVLCTRCVERHNAELSFGTVGPDRGRVVAVADEVPHDVFAALERAEPVLLTRLGRHGVVSIEWVVGFVKPYKG